MSHAGIVNDADVSANNSLSNASAPLISLVAGSIGLGIAVYNLAKSYEKKE